MKTLDIGRVLDNGGSPRRAAVFDSPNEPVCAPARLRVVLHDIWFAMLAGERCVLTGAAGMSKTVACQELLRRVPRSVHAIHVAAAGSRRAALDTISHGMAMIRALRADADGSHEPWRWVLIVEDVHRFHRQEVRELLAWHRAHATLDGTVGLLLVGRPVLERTLEMESDAGMSYRLEPCSFAETQAHVRDWFRLRGLDAIRITAPAMRLIHFASGGVPSRISRLCEHVLRVLELHGRATLTAMVAVRGTWSVLGRSGVI